MNPLPLATWYFSNKAEIDLVMVKLGIKAGPPSPALMAFITGNLALAQQQWPEHKDLFGRLDGAIKETFGIAGK